MGWVGISITINRSILINIRIKCGLDCVSLKWWEINLGIFFIAMLSLSNALLLLVFLVLSFPQLVSDSLFTLTYLF